MTRSRLVPVALAALALATVLVSGCGGASATGPPEIQYGRDVCAECHMIISEARFASAYRDLDGNPYVFDDIGDMVAHADRAGRGEADVTAWVHDYLTEEWVDASAAWFVRSDALTTPMDGGIVAFASREDADTFVDTDGGEILRWPEVFATAGAAVSDHTHAPDHDPTDRDTTDDTEDTEMEEQP